MRRNGFTLVELMVVLMIMGLLGSAVVLTIAAPGGGLQRDAAILAGRIAAARETAVTDGRPISLWVARSGYGFDVYRGGQWQAVTRDPLRATHWKGEVRIEVSGLLAGGAASNGGQPRLVFDNLGLPDAAMTIRLTDDSSTAAVEVAANGDVKVG